MSVKYKFDKKNNKYHFESKTGDKVVIAKETVEKVLKMYSEFPAKKRGGFSVGHIANSTDLETYEVELITKSLGVGRETIPITNEDLDENTDQQIIDSLYEKRKNRIADALEKRELNDLKNKANNWDIFCYESLEPFKNILDKYQPPAIQPRTSKKTDSGQKLYSHIATAADWHFGDLAEKEYMFHGKDQNIRWVKKAVTTYIEALSADLDDVAGKCSEGIFLSLGDLIHSISNDHETMKGTPIKVGTNREKEFEAALNIMIPFLERYASYFPKTKVISLKGNHAGYLDSVLFMAVQKHFQGHKNIEFHIEKAWAKLFQVRRTAVIATHGSSDVTKGAKAPSSDSGAVAYYSSMFMKDRGIFAKTNNRIVCRADIHHEKVKEHADFTDYVFPCILRGNEYADSLNLKARPAQKCLLISDKGVKQTYNYYLD